MLSISVIARLQIFGENLETNILYVLFQPYLLHFYTINGRTSSLIFVERLNESPKNFQANEWENIYHIWGGFVLVSGNYFKNISFVTQTPLLAVYDQEGRGGGFRDLKLQTDRHHYTLYSAYLKWIDRLQSIVDGNSKSVLKIIQFSQATLDFVNSHYI